MTGEYLLGGGILRCALCGDKFGVHIERNLARGTDCRWYQCLGRRRPPAGMPRCKARQHRVSAVDARLWRGLAAAIGASADARQWAVDEREADAWAADVADLEKKLGELVAAETMVLERFTAGHISAGAMDAHLAGSRSRRLALEHALTGAQTARQGARGAVLAAAEQLRRVKAGLPRLAFAGRRELVVAVCDGLRLAPDGTITGTLRVRAADVDGEIGVSGACDRGDRRLLPSTPSQAPTLIAIPLICAA
jgi:hypothetical protein